MAAIGLSRNLRAELFKTLINFILNNQSISTGQPAGTTVLDFVRYHKNLKGTKIGCREGDCGACTVLVGELSGDKVNYRTMTSCLMPLANAAGKHLVTIEGINPADRRLTPVQQAMADESGTQCGFCTVGFVMSLTGFCIDETDKTHEMAVSSIDGNICRCTGYKSIERAAHSLCDTVVPLGEDTAIGCSIGNGTVPAYFKDVPIRLQELSKRYIPVDVDSTNDPLRPFVGGGTDVYVQRHDEMADADAVHLFYAEQLRGIREVGDYIEIGGSATVTDLLVSPLMQSIFPNLFMHLKLISSTPIRNMATLAGNFINASPIGDMTVWFLALDAEIILGSPPYTVGGPTGNTGTSFVPERGVAAVSADGVVLRSLPLKDLYLGYKQLAKTDDEYITGIRFRKPSAASRFNFEKISKRTYLDIATVNTAISLTVRSMPSEIWQPPALTDTQAASTGVDAAHTIVNAHVSAGGVSPVPLYLKETSAFLNGKAVSAETLREANEAMQSEIAPISDVRGSEEYKRLALRQLFYAHFHEMLGVDAV